MNEKISRAKLSQRGHVSPEDEKADLVLTRADESRLEDARAHATNWTAGLSALTGILGTALVVKGPDATAGLESWWKAAIAALLGLAISLLILGTTRLYSAAYGTLRDSNEIKRQPIDGLAARMKRDRYLLSIKVRKRTAQGVSLGLLAIAVLVLALSLSWFAPRIS